MSDSHDDMTLDEMRQRIEQLEDIIQDYDDFLHEIGLRARHYSLGEINELREIIKQFNDWSK